MAKEHKILKGILIAMLSLFLVLNLNLVVFSSMISSTVLNPEFLLKELDALNFYQTARGHVINAMVGQTSTQNAQMVKILNDAITESWLKTQGNSLIRSFFAYLNSQSDELSLKISTIELKKNVESVIRKNIATLLPPPVANDEEQIEKLITEMRSQMDSQFPDTIDLMATIESNERGADFRNNLAQARDFVSYLHMSFYLLVLSAIIVAAIIAMLLKKPEKILRFLGIDMFICGSALFFLRPMVLGMVSSKFTDAQMPSFLSKDILLKILSDIFQPVNDWSIAFMVLGILLVVASFIIKKEEEEKEIKTEVEEELKEVKMEEFKDTRKLAD